MRKKRRGGELCGAVCGQGGRGEGAGDRDQPRGQLEGDRGEAAAGRAADAALSGRAAERAAAMGVRRMQLSLTHSRRAGDGGGGGGGLGGFRHDIETNGGIAHLLKTKHFQSKSIHDGFCGGSGFGGNVSSRY